MPRPAFQGPGVNQQFRILEGKEMSEKGFYLYISRFLPWLGLFCSKRLRQGRDGCPPPPVVGIMALMSRKRPGYSRAGDGDSTGIGQSDAGIR